MAADQHTTHGRMTLSRRGARAVDRPDLRDNLALSHRLAEVDARLDQSIVLAEDEAIVARHVKRLRGRVLDPSLENAGMDQQVAHAALGNRNRARAGGAAAGELGGD